MYMKVRRFKLWRQCLVFCFVVVWGVGVGGGGLLDVEIMASWGKTSFL